MNRFSLVMAMGLLIDCLCLHVYSQEEKTNLVSNGDFEGGLGRVENLWDGVDSSNRLKVISHSAPVVADINGDGLKDIICGDRDWMLWYYLNSGTNESPQFTTGKFIKRRFDYHIKPVVVDWNGDRKQDIVFGSRGGWVCFLRNKGGIRELEFDGAEFIQLGKGRLDIGQFSAPAVADWNGDRKKDLILGEGTYSANSVYVYLNGGTDRNPKFKKGSRQYLAYGEGRMHLTPCVVDGDGDLDLVVGDENGHINLYLSVSVKRRTLDKEKVTVLEYAGRLKADNGREIDVGSMSTPFVVDWDEDGDWDIVCGNSSGYIHLIVNQGTNKEPKFAQPEVLKGTDVYKDVAIPSSWTQDSRSYHTMARRGAYQIMADEDAYSGKYSLKVICYDDYAGATAIAGRLGKALERDVRYELTFYVKGKNASGTWRVSYGGASERAIVDGRRTYRTLEGGWGASGEFRAGSSWKKVTGKFKPPKIKDKKLKKKLGKTIGCTLEFHINGEGPVWIDNVSLVKK